jgi:hypothetical protein
MTLTIGIPSRGVSTSLVRVLQHALSLPKVGEILVGINPGDGDTSLLNQFLDLKRIVFFEHQENIGLYGNFRFLLNKASHSHFQWFCVDDEASSTLITQLEKYDSGMIKLAIPTWFWSEYDPIKADFNRAKLDEGVYPCFLTSKNKVSSIIHAEPSWIFGIWNTQYLKSIFPNRDFDWLDVYLLQRALLDNVVEVVDVKSPMIIGTWHWADKIPAPTSGRYHNPFFAIALQIYLTPRISLMHFSGFRLSIRRIKSLVVQSRAMNRLISERFEIL